MTTTPHQTRIVRLRFRNLARRPTAAAALRSCPVSRAADNQAKLRRTLVLLQRMYGPRVWKRRGSGLDLLVEAMLAQNTNMANATRGYRMLRRALPTWAAVMEAPVGDVQRQITICGLARMRAKRLQELLAAIKADRGRLSLEFLKDEPTDAAFDYLMSFHGIGPKTAAFTLLFAFGHPVLPVDNGILRVVRRLRLVRAKARDLETERTLSPLIARGRHYPMHVLMFQHAKARCRPKNPKCHECLLREICPYGERRVRHAPPPKEIELKPPGRMRPVILSRFASDGVSKRAEKD
jgi:endonuclease-3